MTSPVPPVNEAEDDNQLRMSLLGHLDELRRRLVKVAIAFVLAGVVGLLIAEPVLQFLKQPYGTNQFITLGPTDSVVAYFRVVLMVAGILAVPVITYQALMFIVPGLTDR